MDQAAGPVPAQDSGACIRSGWMRTPGRRPLLQRPVRAMHAVVIGVLVQDQSQVAFAAATATAADAAVFHAVIVAAGGRERNTKDSLKQAEKSAG